MRATVLGVVLSACSIVGTYSRPERDTKTGKLACAGYGAPVVDAILFPVTLLAAGAVFVSSAQPEGPDGVGVAAGLAVVSGLSAVSAAIGFAVNRSCENELRDTSASGTADRRE